ncbi:MAG: 2-oxo acid dehydrogenase subunit E2, partial [Rhodothermales bacterium]|nr:2-oxo acid dehydrogenase subunit E2 [Rhodothermales bacterium]
GRIIKRDVEAALESAPAAEAPSAAPARPAPAAAPSEAGYESVRISQMRKTIAKRLAESKFTSPHFYLTAEMDMEKAVAFRSELNETAAQNDLAKVSFNDLVTKACALALRKHRWVNASWMQEEGEIRLHDDVHVAVAVAVDEGLITPVIRHADRKGLAQIAAETRELAAKARNKEIQPEEYTGSTFSTSNLGMFGIEEFTAIINPPNACILAIGAIRDVPVVKNGAVVPGKRMKVTLSCDHRVVDGATGSEFLTTVRGYLEDPLTMLL